MTRARARAEARGAARAPVRAAQAAPARSGSLAPLLVLVGLAALAFTTRGAPLGVPVADDYAFLDRLRFQHPLDPFDSMGAAFYWRPLSRQLYFLLVGPHLVGAPWVAPAVAALLLAALFGVVFRVARHALPAPAAAAVALFPLTTESARVLLDWPSGAQHLLAMVFAALAVHEALARRALPCALALLAGLLSHESAVIAAPVCGWLLARGGVRRALPVAGALLAWAAGYLVARGHGVALPAPAASATPVARLPGLFARALTAQLDLEDLKEPARGLLVIGYGFVCLVAVAFLYDRQVRRRLRAAAPALLAGLAWFAVGTLPLVVLLPDWNAWRDSVPGLGFGFAATGFLAVVSPALALAFAGLRLAALLCAAPAAPAPTAFPAVTATDMSFVRLARLQGIAEGTRRALLLRHPTLPRGADVHYASLPRMAEVGLEGPLALKVWYGDTTLTWGTFSSAKGFARPEEVVVAYDTHRRWGATVIEPAALQQFGDGIAAMMARRLPEADSLLASCRTRQPRRSDEFEGLIVANQARIALSRQDFARADSLIGSFEQCVGKCADYYGLLAGLELARGRLEPAHLAVDMCLRLEPQNKIGMVVRQSLARVEASGPPAARGAGAMPAAPASPFAPFAGAQP